MEQDERLAITTGQVRAISFMVGILIKTHPQRDEALRAFDELLPEWTDLLATDASRTTSPAFHMALQEKLATFRVLLGAA